MNISLAGLGWLTDAPAGNRLRWSYPLLASDSADDYLGLPKTIIVERAWLDEDIPQQVVQGKTASAPSMPLPPIPVSWWNSYGDVHPTGFLQTVHQLPRPVQAARFTYRGTKARLRVYDSAANALVAERIIDDGDLFHLEAPVIDRFEVLAISPTFQNFMTLDLFVDRGLPWEEIAHIRVADTVNFDLEQVKLRYDLPPTLTPQEWKEFVNMAVIGQASNPSTLVKGNPTAWEAFSVLMGLRWEHALLFGHAFFDGPRNDVPKFDELKADLLLSGVQPTAVAYRVREADERVGHSNIVVCPPWIVPPLSSPSQPQYENPKVQLTTDIDTEQPKFVATYGLSWQQSEVRALGVQIHEETSGNLKLGSSAETETYDSRTRYPENPPLYGELARSRDVSFHDVQVRCRARATDGWDRTSTYSTWTPWTVLTLYHEPPAPNMTVARYSSGTVRLTRQVGYPNFPDWQPDLIIKNDISAKLFVYRRKTGPTGDPVLQTVNLTTPMWVEGNRYRTTVTGVASLAPFLNGYLIVPPFKAMIRALIGNNVYFEIGDGMTTLFSTGSAQLQQDPKDLDLWIKVAEFDANTLPAELVFTDPVSGPMGTADVLSYHTRLSYLGGRIGPGSNTVQAFRIPHTPVEPPPFSVETLGIDFYNRTMVKIRFTNPVIGGLYTVWWASGALTSAQFEKKAVPGELRAQSTYQGRYLFDVLAIPLPQTVNRTITLGVQQVNEGEGQSKFKTVQVTLSALTP